MKQIAFYHSEHHSAASVSSRYQPYNFSNVIETWLFSQIYSKSSRFHQPPAYSTISGTIGWKCNCRHIKFYWLIRCYKNKASCYDWDSIPCKTLAPKTSPACNREVASSSILIHVKARRLRNTFWPLIRHRLTAREGIRKHVKWQRIKDEGWIGRQRWRSGEQRGKERTKGAQCGKKISIKTDIF